MDSMEILENHNLSDYTSWKVGGNAHYYCRPQSIEDIHLAIRKACEKSWPIRVLGGGTNVLISDRGVSGLVLHTCDFNKVDFHIEENDLLITSQAGAAKSEVLKVFLKHRLEPAVFLAGLPGDMAGGVVMNAGVGHRGTPKDFGEIFRDMRVLTWDDQGMVQEKTFTKEQLQWSYRKTQGWQPGIIVEVRVQWPLQPDDSVLERVREGNKRRKSTQPLQQPSCGSVFKNPDGNHAGRLIETAGLKSYQDGGAQVSEKHGNFIVNTGDATASEIDRVIRHVQSVVKQKSNIELTNEVVYFGDW